MSLENYKDKEKRRAYMRSYMKKYYAENRDKLKKYQSNRKIYI